MKYLEKAKSFLFEPSRAFKKEQKTSFGDAFKYLLVLGIVLAVLSGIVIAGMAFNVITFVPVAVGMYITTIISLLICGLILHVFAYIVGARKGIGQTFKAVIYGATPTLILGWIPFIGWIFGIYSIVLGAIGLKNLHNISTGRAILAVLLTIIILGILALIGLLVLLAAFASMGGLPADFMGSFTGGFPSQNLCPLGNCALGS